MAEALHCYRHPDRETYVSCSECGRGICPDCMTFGPVGIRCPDHAAVAGQTAAPKRAARQASRSLARYGPYVTFTLIGLNVGIFLLELLLGGRLNGTGNWIYEHGALVRLFPFSYGIGGVAEGEWWRLMSAAFLHYGPLHLGLNMLVLWFIGPALEDYFGHARYLLLYVVGGLAGSAGALIMSPDSLTVGASGAIFGLMGSALILEWRKIYVFGGQALGLVVVNLLFSFVFTASGGSISIGGHIGGLIGGAAATLVFISLRRKPALATLGVAGVGVLSVAVALVSI